MLRLLIGPVGSGKSRYARRKVASTGGVLLDLDEWMVRLFGEDERPPDPLPWYLERRERCRDVMWDVAQAVVAAGSDVWLELGLVTRAERAAACARADVELYLLDAPREVRRARVEARNASAGPGTQVVPLPMFELASDAWEPVTEDERSRWRIVDV